MSSCFHIKNIYDKDNVIIGSVLVEDNVVKESSDPSLVGRYYTDAQLSDRYCFKIAASLQTMCNRN